MPAHPSERIEPTLDGPDHQDKINPYAPPQSDVGQRVRSGALLPHQKAGRVIRLMAVLGAVSIVGIGVAVLLPVGPPPVELVVLWSVGLALIVALFFVASAIMRYKVWGRYAGIAYGLLSLVGFPLGTLIGAYVLWQLVFGWSKGAAEA